MAHETDEDLSALIDDELTADAASRVREHAASCAKCGERLERFRAASVKFKRSGERPIPAGLIERVKKTVRPRLASLELVFMVVMILGVVLVSGAMLKKFMPSLFNNVQSMITGAASASGSSK